MTLNCMIVDDDELSRVLMTKFVEQTEFLNLTHVLDNTIEASNILIGDKNNDVDLVFLDVQMPEMTGMDLVKTLGGMYPVVLITANREHATEAFEGSALDFLVKPIEYSRFLRAAVKAREQREKELKYAESENHIFVKSDSRLVRIPYTDLFFVEALADYVIFNTAKGKYIVHHTMKGIEKKLPISIFSRVHRSYIVNRNKVNHIEDFNISISDKIIPVGASYREQFLSKINLL